ncbi:MAG: hypothetical protein QOG02_2185, partial [Gaiellales bacterium]|nr:hypothetical protein [Gaiellales bacterium]
SKIKTCQLVNHVYPILSQESAGTQKN